MQGCEAQCPRIELNIQNKRQLPYIQIKNPPLKLLIDTGANQSFLSPEVAQKYYPDVELNYEPFVVTNIHASTVNYHSVTIPCFKEIQDKKQIKLFIYKFHEYFDGLIGCDLLQQWRAKIDLNNKLFSTEFANNTIRMYASGQNNLLEQIISAHSSKIVQVPTTISSGEIYIEEQVISNCNINECISTAKNNVAFLEISNHSDNDIIFALSDPIQVQLFNTQSLQLTRLPRERTRDVLSQLRTQHLNEEEKCNLLNLCSEYSDIFYIEGEQLTFTNQIKHKINTTDDIPVHSKTYRYPYVHKEEIQNQIQSMLSQGIIRPSTSAWSAPIWIVPKKPDASGKTKWRLVVDFRKLNEKTIDDKYPIPNIVEVLDKLGNCQYFSTLDLTKAFYQVQLDPRDIYKTGFNVERGHYEFLRMPMGLKNSPSTFQRVMDDVLKDLLNRCCVVYQDDILCFSTSLQEHMVNLKKIFQRLRETNFKIQMEKSEFLKRETPYLGHVITPEGVKPNPDKISAISKYPLPKTTKQIKAFLGLLGYYRRFIPDFAKITKPFTKCLKKGTKIVINDTYVKCFEHCKTLLTNDPILIYPDFTKDFILTTDSSNYALGAVLSQGAIGSDRPVAYASRTLNESEINYSTIEKELLAIVWATKYFRPYLFGRKFKIITDHKPLQWLMNLKEPNSRLTRWRLKLAEFNYTIIYKKGKSNTNADALSRVEIFNENASMIVNLPDTESCAISATYTDPEYQEILSSSSTLTAHTSAENPILEMPISDDPLNKFKRQLVLNIIKHKPRTTPTVTKPFNTYFKTSIDIFEDNLEENLAQIIESHVDPKIRTALLINPIEKMYDIVSTIQRLFNSSVNNIFLVKRELRNVTIPQEQTSIIRNYHEGKTNHRGTNETFMSLSQHYFWPKMRESISKYISDCEVCSSAKYDRNPIRPEFRIVPPPSRPFEVAHADVLSIEREKYLTIIDAFSKYAQVYPIPDCTGPTITKYLLKFASHHGFPLLLITDNGKDFENHVVNEFLRLHNVQHKTTMPYAPNQNGIIERFHCTILEHLRLLKLKHKNEAAINLLPYALIAYNSSVHSFTKCRPFDVISGHFDPRDPIHLNTTERLMQQYVCDHRDRMETVYQLIHESSSAHRDNIMNRINSTREPQIDYEPNQEIFIRNPAADRQKLAPRFNSDRVINNSPIHIYTTKNRAPVAKNRLKRPLKNKTTPLLQVPPNTDPIRCGTGSGDTPE